MCGKIGIIFGRKRRRPDERDYRLEGFRPGGHSMYQRVMVAVLCGRTSIPAWIYQMSCPLYAKLWRLDARYPVLLQTRHPRPVSGNRGIKSVLWSGWREVVM